MTKQTQPSSQLPFTMPSSNALPDVITGYVSAKSKGGKSAAQLKSLPRSAKPFHAKSADANRAQKMAEDAGLTILAESPLGFAVAGPGAAYEELTGGKLVMQEQLMYSHGARQRYVSHIDIQGRGQPKDAGCGKLRGKSTAIEMIMLESPRQYAGIQPSPIPPSVSKFHLRVPGDVALGLGAPAVHRNGITGAGVTVAMVDSGQQTHPYFAAHGYDVRPTTSVVPGTDPGEDPVGHGTGEAANIFAAAPGSTLDPYRASNNQGRLVGAIAGFLTAKAAAPRILTNSWGGNGPYNPFNQPPPSQADITWALEILDTVQQGIVVVFSAGNGSFTIEPQVPGVLAAGGVYMENDIDLRASNYASGYDSPWINNRRVPDVCGLVGLLPRADYIMLPVPGGCDLDVSQSLPDGPAPGDGTQANDGWGLFSGTSAAAPQLAGIAALILEARPNATPAQVVQAMTASAIDVRMGNCHPRFNNAATVGPDSATGHGLANAQAAVQHAIDNF
ncbi:MAG: S8 family serine peptidase [Xanthomonadales bacterium]|nr:S8 family serine peptidase [Xanthomonadales bacterium]